MTIAATAETPVLRRTATLVIGLVLIAAGVASMIRAEVGVAPFDVLTTGLAEVSGLEIGIAAMVLPFLFALAGWALGRRPGPGTVIAVFAVGPILGLVLSALPETEMMAGRIPYFTVGFVLVSVGITGVIVAELGPGPSEVLMLALHDRGHPLALARTAIEIACVAVGWALGGQIGAGTVVVALLLGPTLRFLLTTAGYQAQAIEEAVDCAAPGA